MCRVNQNIASYCLSFTGGIRGTAQFRNVQESELIVETKKTFKPAPGRARNAAAVAGTKYEEYWCVF